MNKNRIEALKNKFEDILWRNYLYKGAFFSFRRANYKEYRRKYVKNIVIKHEDGSVTKKPVAIQDKSYVDNLLGNDVIKNINTVEAKNVCVTLMEIASVKLQRYMKDCEEKSKTPTTQEILDVVFGKNKDEMATCLVHSIWSTRMYQILVKNAEEEDLFIDELKSTDIDVEVVTGGDYYKRLEKPEISEDNKSEEKIEVAKTKVETKTDGIPKEPVIEETKADETEEDEQVEELNVDFEKVNKLIVGIRENKELVYFGDLTDDNRDLVNITNDEIIVLNSTLISTFTEDEVKFMFDEYLNIDYIKAVVDMVNTVANGNIETWTKDYLVKLTDRAVNNVMYDINEVLGVKEENFEEKGE
jgi:hypothetical protein